MKHVSPQQQVWQHLRTDGQRAILATSLRHLKRRTQENICYGILAYIRWGILRPFEDKWLKGHFDNIILYLKTERTLGNL